MQPEEQRLIENLFHRLKKVEQVAESRDIEADQHIQNFVRQQPAAPYYMAQSLLIQEAALNQLHQHIQHLQNEVAHLKNNQKEKRTHFLGRLFNGRSFQKFSQPPLQMPVSHSNSFEQYSSNTSRCGNNFISNALQTAVGVAGGVVLGNMLNNIFHHSSSKEIINSLDDQNTSIIEDNHSFFNKDLDAQNVVNNASDQHDFNHKDIFSSDNSDENEFDDNEFNNDNNNDEFI